MAPVGFPIHPGDHGPTVVALQAALKLLLENHVITLQGDDKQEHARILRLFEEEIASQKFGAATKHILVEFQRPRHLHPHAQVDQRTANAINTEVHNIGVIDPVPSGVMTVAGTVSTSSGNPVRDQVVVLYQMLRPPRVVLVGKGITDPGGHYSISYRLAQLSDTAKWHTTVGLRVTALGKDGERLASKELKNKIMIFEIVDLSILDKPTLPYEYTITGQLILENFAPAEGVKLHLDRREFGGAITHLASTTTVAGGFYSLKLVEELPSHPSSLEIRTVTNAGKTVRLTQPLNDLGRKAITSSLNLVAPNDVTQASLTGGEYVSLVRSVAPLVGGSIEKLADAREDDDERGDLTVLSKATGWDARLIAIAASAERLAGNGSGLSRDALYGLLRVGLPADKETLAHVTPDLVEVALRKACNAGVVQLQDEDIYQFKARFLEFSKETKLAMMPSGSRSSYRSFIQASGLVHEDQAKFESAFLLQAGSESGDSDVLWNEARQAGLGEKQISTLQLQGKLAFLTNNSEKVMSRLLEKVPKAIEELAELEYFRPDAWIDDILDIAGVPKDHFDSLSEDESRKLVDTLPLLETDKSDYDEVNPNAVKARVVAYASDMARKVSQGFPTEVIGKRLAVDGIFQLPECHEETVALIRSATKRGFQFGHIPVEQFLAKEELPEASSEGAVKQMKLLQRVYQVTPSHEAMPVLIRLNMTSGYDIMAQSADSFVSSFNAKFLDMFDAPPPTHLAHLIWRKASQISSITYNLFVSAKRLQNEGIISALSSRTSIKESVKSKLVKRFPTLESMFGSLDFCECHHCRSVLSPAAYLVDLFQFIDVEPGVWDSFLAQWKANHGGTEYPHQNSSGVPLKPYDVLVERRPDLLHIVLSCENTNTPMPHIDIINEILENFVVSNGKLDKLAHNTDPRKTTDDLLAEPEYIVHEAYDELAKACYPLQFPFDLWIETVREMCDYSDVPLEKILNLLRSSDKLFSTNATSRFNIWMESLGLSPFEIAVLTNEDFLSGGGLQRMYGLPSVRIGILSAVNDPEPATVTVADNDAENIKKGMAFSFVTGGSTKPSKMANVVAFVHGPGSGGTALTRIDFEKPWETSGPTVGDYLICNVPTSLKSAKTLSRHLGITYKELHAIFQTAFINPELDSLSLLSKIGVSIQDVRLFNTQYAFYQENKKLIITSPEQLSPADRLRLQSLTKTMEDTNGRSGYEVLSDMLAFDRRLAAVNLKYSGSATTTSTEDTDGDDGDDNQDSEYDNSYQELREYLKNLPFGDIVVLSDPDASCSFERTVVQNADGSKPGDAVYLRINLFTRLWRKLDWSLEDLDRALGSFVPSTAPIDVGNMRKDGMQTTLIYLSHVKMLDKMLSKSSRNSRKELVTLWSGIDTTGSNSTYARLFLSTSVLRRAPVFDNPLGKYLQFQHDGEYKTFSYDPTLPEDISTGNVSLSSYLPVVQGALELSSQDIHAILLDGGLSIESAALSLDTLSLLLKHKLLATRLDLSVSELISLKTLSGLNPFKQLYPAPLVSVDQDVPFCQTIRFVEVTEQVKRSAMDIEDLDYLLRHRFDEVGKYRPDRKNVFDLLDSIAKTVRDIRIEHATDASISLSDEALQRKLALVLTPDVVERFLAMMNGTVELTATIRGVQSDHQLKPETYAEEPCILSVTYEPVEEEQTLVFRGVLLDMHKEQLKQKFPSEVFSVLLDDVQQQAIFFFERHLQERNERPRRGFLKPKDFDRLFSPTEAIEGDKRRRLIEVFLPYLQQRLIHQFVVDTLSAFMDAEPNLIEALVADGRMLTLKLEEQSPLTSTFEATFVTGLSASFFESEDLSGTPMDTKTVPSAEIGPVEAGSAVPNSARFEGYLKVSVSGMYRIWFNVISNSGDDHNENNFLIKFDEQKGSQDLKEGALVELRRGELHGFSVELKNLNGLRGHVLVQGGSTPAGPLSQLVLHPRSILNDAERAIILLRKSLQLIQELDLSEQDIRHILSHSEKFADISLSSLPTEEEIAKIPEKFEWWRRLSNYARLKSVLHGAEKMISIFEAQEIVDGGGNNMSHVYALIAGATRREVETVTAMANIIFSTPRFADERPLVRLLDALAMVERFGVGPQSLLDWTKIVSADVSPFLRAEIANDVKDAIRVRVGSENWTGVGQLIFDKLRRKQRDALVAYSMVMLQFDRVEQLQEYFLLDTGMEPVVQTSRIRMAISVFQSFVQRCLLNLEPKVHASAINAKQWEWMKRYRVWEANRKIFLFPENWLEPEFRDDKTHLFSEVESALLQQDVSSETVDKAFLGYLMKLDALARLEIITMHLEDNDDFAQNTLHVFGRTHGYPHEYFYRRYENEVWTPWDPVGVNIEGDHIAPVMWRDRMYLFWVTFLDVQDKGSVKMSDNEPNARREVSQLNMSEVVDAVSTLARRKKVQIGLNWAEKLQDRWLHSESSEYGAAITEVVSVDFEPSSVSVFVTKEPYKNGVERGVSINLRGGLTASFYLAGRNSVPVSGVAWLQGPPRNLFGSTKQLPTRNEGTGQFTVSFTHFTQTRPVFRKLRTTKSLFGRPRKHTVLASNDGVYGSFLSEPVPEASQLVKPIFYQDMQHNLFLEPEVKERTVKDWTGWFVPWRFQLRAFKERVTTAVVLPEIARIPGFPSTTSVDARSLIRPRAGIDTFINPRSYFEFDNKPIGAGGLLLRSSIMGLSERRNRGTTGRFRGDVDPKDLVFYDVGHEEQGLMGSDSETDGLNADITRDENDQETALSEENGIRVPGLARQAFKYDMVSNPRFHGISYAKGVYDAVQLQAQMLPRLGLQRVQIHRSVKYRVTLHQHPYVQTLMKRLIDKGAKGLQGADTEYITRARVKRKTSGKYEGGATAILTRNQPVQLFDGTSAVHIPDGDLLRFVAGKVIKQDQALTLPEKQLVEIAGKTRLRTQSGAIVVLNYDTLVELQDGGPRPLLYDDFFAASYHPSAKTVRNSPDAPHPVKELDFSLGGPYSVYNWELFYHIPFMFAVHLSKNQRFSEAQKWFHLLFDPTDDSEGPTPERYWKVRPFQNTPVNKIEELLLNLATDADPVMRKKTISSIEAWKSSPFRPHVIARYRQEAYMYKTVMAYLDNLIAWGDSLFRQNTGEAVDEALQMYLLAANILGPRPQPVPQKGTVRMQSYASLRQDLSLFGSAMLEVEGDIAFDLMPFPSGVTVDNERAATMRGLGKALFFCVPRNDRLIGYWETVHDRLFKIRNSLSLEGVFRRISLFEPPIDPAMLVKAAAVGLDVGSVISGLNQPLPLVRFAFLVQRASEVVQEVRQLGSMLLSAMEREDGAALELLRAQHERAVLDSVEHVRYSQVQEAATTRQALIKSLEGAVQRYSYYERQLGRDEDEIRKSIPDLAEFREEDLKTMKYQTQEPAIAPRPINVDIAKSLADFEDLGGALVSSHELQAMRKSAEALEFEILSKYTRLGSKITALIPQYGLKVQFMGIGGDSGFGGEQISRAISYAADALIDCARETTSEAQVADKTGSYTRRQMEWTFQSNVIVGEINQMFKQIRAAEIREAVAKLELRNHRRTMKNAEEIERFLNEEGTFRTGKRANKAMYTWMKREIKGLYAQYFQFAFDVARRAERALQHEIGDPRLSYVKFDYLAGKDGLLAGERLALDVKRMEMAFHDQNRRSYELTKHISLLQVDPMALVQFRTTGRCTTRLAEALFDMDGPGHYFRRIKTVAVSIPCVTGPYASINCSLVLTKSSIRTTSVAGENYARQGAEDDRFTDYFGCCEAMVTSSGQHDGGLFDENLRDERYLPFENAGVISEWQLALPANPSEGDPVQFDYQTISDVILHMRYTAREGGDVLRNKATQHAKQLMKQAEAVGSVRLFDVRRDFPEEWHKFKRQGPSNGDRFELLLKIRPEHYPIWSVGRLKRVKRMNILALSAREDSIEVSNSADGAADVLSRGAIYGAALQCKVADERLPERPEGELRLFIGTRLMTELWIAIQWGDDD